MQQSLPTSGGIESDQGVRPYQTAPAIQIIVHRSAQRSLRTSPVCLRDLPGRS